VGKSKSCCSSGDPLVNGKKAERIPGYQVRITPMYTLSLSGAAHVDLFTTFTAIGKRYGDLQNQQPLPAYHTVSAGFIVNIHRLAFQLTGDNLFNSHGLTEGILEAWVLRFQHPCRTFGQSLAAPSPAASPSVSKE